MPLTRRSAPSSPHFAGQGFSRESLLPAMQGEGAAKRRMKGACILVAGVLAACSGTKQKPADEKVPVTVAVAQTKNVPTEIRAIGNVKPRSNVAVRALVAGELTRVWFKEGDDVHKGQTLFTIDPRPYEAALSQARANLARDEAGLKNAESQAARYADLVKKDYVTREEYDKFTTAADAARAGVAADRAAVETAQLQLSYCEIRSPLNGRTGSLMVHPGNLVKANDTTPLVVINQITPVDVEFSIPESQLAQLRAVGSPKIAVQALPQGGGMPIATGTLSFVDNTIDPTTGTITLKATFPNTNRALWPGQFVNVAAVLAQRPNSIVVPAQAVQTGQKGQYVFVVTQDNGVEMRPVRSTQSFDQFAVIDKGVAAGETVVTDGQLRLTPKSKVEVKIR
jgi:membrane fusion protein, multidrug efflux system